MGSIGEVSKRRHNFSKLLTSVVEVVETNRLHKKKNSEKRTKYCSVTDEFDQVKSRGKEVDPTLLFEHTSVSIND